MNVCACCVKQISSSESYAIYYYSSSSCPYMRLGPKYLKTGPPQPLVKLKVNAYVYSWSLPIASARNLISLGTNAPLGIESKALFFCTTGGRAKPLRSHCSWRYILMNDCSVMKRAVHLSRRITTFDNIGQGCAVFPTDIEMSLQHSASC